MSKKPARNHPWRLGLSGPAAYANRSTTTWRGFFRGPNESAPVRTLTRAEIEELGLELSIPVKEIMEARRMCQQEHPDRGGDPMVFQYWKERLDRLKRRTKR
ncbi:MAG: hypothetical protein QF921_18375 [Pseudomonadales bacterium]|jgi:hypothetical protein|nr:hypothetical protein [Pseudomonadales bacterium]MDP6472365.1 hypothetical protein [Pseudomonadales bacterium]MDP6828161.1 hypothetical protein [Pseudomonadales bacterium]MDP6973454.1 hypothetical protein [Pseudomonadales bacterium]|tara:strand:- start:519 stop:824 length:306 start_codon:yes stop_codon:yes gene_type:complete